MLGQAIGKNSMILALFAVCTAGVLAGTYQLTKSKIAASERAAAQKALLEIIPLEQHDNDLLTDTLAIPPEALTKLGDVEGKQFHLARQNGDIVAVILPARAPDGYSGAIDLIVGINRDQTLAGVRVLSHNETPGLGDKIDLRKSEWILSFNGKSLGQPAPEKWAVAKDGGEFDQFTGATITPRAVVEQVKQVLEYYRDHEPVFISQESSNTSSNTSKER